MPIPLISIITPTFNSEKYIERTLKSISQQSCDAYEHIIIDAKSSDTTLEIVRYYCNIYPITFISEKDEGISDAFNKGVRLSKGDWLLFLGAGDELFNSSVLEDVTRKIQSERNNLIMCGNIVYKDDYGNKGIRYKSAYKRSRLKQYMCYHHQSIFHNKQLFVKWGFFDKKIKIAMDYDLLLRAYNEINDNCYIDIDIAYVLTGGNSQKSNLATLKDSLRVRNKNKVCFTIFSYVVYYWAILKYFLRRIINYNNFGLSSEE